MKMTRRLSCAGVSALALAAFAGSALAQTEIRILRPETGNEAHTAMLDSYATEYEALTPGVDVEFEFLDNESFKQKLPTMLQSDQRPDIFYSWGGGVLEEQARAGFLENITDAIAGDWAAEYPEAGINAFTVDGAVVGVPINASDIGFWVNRDLAAQAGIDIDAIRTWDQFLAAVEAAKAAGVTPIMVGGKDKWPLQFYLAYLAVRVAGADGFAAAMAGEGDGFASPAFLQAATMFEELVALEPFQPGFMDTDYGTASGMFGDGRAVFHLMGDWDHGASRSLSANGGLTDDQLALVRFPMVDGGAGNATDTYGGLNGWAVAAGASPEALDFLRWMNARDNQAREAAAGFFIPVALGADTAVTNPFFQQISASLAQSTFHQLFVDQALGADVGATFNDISADLAAGAIDAQQAVETLQEAWDFR
jgi:raffinose/stachyose/melibiose transport system substrate-binding protein